MAFKSSYQFDLTLASVKEQWPGQRREWDDTVLERAMDAVCGELCAMIRNKGVEPTAITEADYPDDLVSVQELVCIGTVARYERRTGSANAAWEKFEREYQALKGEFDKRPTKLNSSSASSGTSTLYGMQTTIAPSAFQTNRVKTPRYPNVWNQ